MMADEKVQDGRPGEGEAPTEPITKPIELYYPEDTIGRYSNQLLVQFGQHECNISFFDIKPPVLLGSPEEQREQLKSVESVRAVCVARIVVAKEFVPEIIAALQRAWTMHLTRMGKAGGKEGE
jgi:hypothetical protein